MTTPKSHPLLKSDGAFSLLAAVLVQIKRKHGTHYTLEHAQHDLYDVLECLRVAGYHVLPKGLFDALKRSLNDAP